MFTRLAILAAVALGTVASASSGVLLSEEAALARAFSEVAPQRRIVYLTPDQVEAVQKKARSRLPSAIVTVYEARSAGALVARAVLDTDVVRTMPATVLTVIAPDGTLKMALVLQFAEPADYLPREGWLQTLEGRALDDDLWPGRGVHRVTGATLTVQALTDAVRRALALDALVLRSTR
jgi:Na+-translocating ferredoxin:NAD+ oxidoreductase RnfG subunit